MSIDELGGRSFDEIGRKPMAEELEALRELQEMARERATTIPGNQTIRHYGGFACCGGCDCPAAQVIEGVLEGEAT